MAQILSTTPQGLLLLGRQASDAAAGAVSPELPQQSLDLPSYPTTGLQQFGFFIIFFFPAVSVLLVGLRVYDRVVTRLFGVDDAFILMATVCRFVSALHVPPFSKSWPCEGT